MNIKELWKGYKRLEPLYEQLNDEVESILKKALKEKEKEIPCDFISGRVKSFDSIKKNLGSDLTRQSIRKLTDIKDICGVRVACLFLPGIKSVGTIIRKIFEVEEEENKIISQADESFGYMSVHYICKLPAEYRGPRYDEIKKLRFEIQVRTLAMHCWAAISHYLDYKAPRGIAPHLRKDFYSLNGVFYLADSHLEHVYLMKETAKKLEAKKASSRAGFQKEKIYAHTLAKYFEQTYTERPHEADLSVLAEWLSRLGYKTIRDLKKELERSKKAFDKYESQYPPGGIEGARYTDEAAVRSSLAIASEKALVKTGYPEALQKILREFRQYCR